MRLSLILTILVTYFDNYKYYNYSRYYNDSLAVNISEFERNRKIKKKYNII